MGSFGVAYFFTQSRAVASCFCLLRLYSCAMFGTSGSEGFGSVKREERERMTLYRESAGDQLFLRIWG